MTTADFSPHELNLRLKQDNLTAVTFTFSDTDFTGYTDATLKWALRMGDTATSVSMTIDDAPNGVISVIFTSTEWATLGLISEGHYQVNILNGSGGLEILVNGRIHIEESL